MTTSSAVLTCVVETPKGSRNKYEYDEGLARIRFDRFLAAPLVYPADYGFIPGTLSEDGDPLDALICVSEATFPGCAIDVKPVALFEMEDEHGRDDTIVCVPCGDPAWIGVDELEDLPDQLRDEIGQFFSTYKDLDPARSSLVLGWRGRSDAIATTDAARERFHQRASTTDKKGANEP